MRRPRAARPHVDRSAFAGFRFPPEVITLAVRWYLRYGLSYRDVEGACCVQSEVAGLGSGRSAGHMARASSVNAVARRSGGETLVASS